MRTKFFSLLTIVLLATLTIGALWADDRPFVDRQRQLEIVAEEGSVLTLDGVRWGFDDNDLEKPRFSRTTVDLSRVREVYYWSQRFNPEWLAAHGMLVFLMDSEDAIQGAQGQRDIGLVMTVEVHYRKGDSYSPIKGLGKNYRIIYQVTTVGDRIQWAMSMWNQEIRQYRLDLSPDKRKALFKNALVESAVDRKDEWYNTVTNSCVSNAFRVINSVVEKKRKLHLWRIPKILFNMQIGLPNVAPGYLCRRGVGVQEPTIERDCTHVSFPTKTGSYHIDVVQAPGLALADDKLPICLGVAQLYRWGEAMNCLVKLNGLLSPNTQEFWYYLEEQQRLSDSLYELQDKLLAHFDENFEENVQFYLGLEMKQNGVMAQFNGALLDAIRFKVQNGEVSERLVTEAQEKFKGE